MKIPKLSSSEFLHKRWRKCRKQEIPYIETNRLSNALFWFYKQPTTPSSVRNIWYAWKRIVIAMSKRRVPSHSHSDKMKLWYTHNGMRCVVYFLLASCNVRLDCMATPWNCIQIIQTQQNQCVKIVKKNRPIQCCFHLFVIRRSFKWWK